MDNLLQGILGVVTYLDDILITGATEEEHLKSIEEVLRLLIKAGLRVKKHKCSFMVPRVSYLGDNIDAHGLHPLSVKLWQWRKHLLQKDVTELKSYPALLTYYGEFLPNLATTLAPVYELLGKGVKWHRKLSQKRAFLIS